MPSLKELTERLGVAVVAHGVPVDAALTRWRLPNGKWVERPATAEEVALFDALRGLACIQPPAALTAGELLEEIIQMVAQMKADRWKHHSVTTRAWYANQGEQNAFAMVIDALKEVRL